MCVEIKSHRRALSKFRCSSHILAIEKGRHNKIDYNDRLCKYCKRNGINKVEDEYHVLLECSKYTMIRERLLPVYYYKEPYHIKFINLLTTGNESLLRSLSKLVFEIFKNIEL